MWKLVLLAVLPCVLADEYCFWYPNGYHHDTQLKYCSFDCCNEYGLTDPCCTGLSTWVIATIVVGAIIAIIAVIVAIVYGRRRYVRRTTVQYSQYLPPQTQVVTTSTQSGYMPPPTGPMAPPPYQQQQQPNPNYATNYKTF